MIDLVKLKLLAGDGGQGKISFRREKYVPKGGPDGGRGGNGGNIIIRLNTRLGTLQHLTGIKSIEGKAGGAGAKRQQFGADGEDQVVEVPSGTIVWLLAENKVSKKRRERYGLTWHLKRSEVRFQRVRLPKIAQPPETTNEPDELEPVADDIDVTASGLTNLQQHNLPKLVEINADNPELLIAQGGYGGLGNESFKSSTQTTPLVAEYGSPGEQKIVLLELRLLADVGLIGFPNAGKSTLLSRLTSARPKIANYPFTTLEPQLGVLALSKDQEVVMADIPGVIEGAHEGKGLGFTFLKHLSHCRVLIFMLALSEAEVFDESLPIDQKVASLATQFKTLQTELSSFDPEFLSKQTIVCINKTDVYSAELIDAIKSIPIYKTNNAILISSITGENLEKLTKAIQKAISHS